MPPGRFWKQLRRSCVGRAVALPLLVGLTVAACQEKAERYNVILISADALRADRLNCYGYQEHEVSPRLDALARDGVVFENHIAASPWTTPSHMSLLTSLHPSTHGVMQSFGELMVGLYQNNFNRLPDSKLTLAEALRADGYATAAFTGGITLDPKIGFDQGFSIYDTSMYKLNDRNMEKMLNWITSHAAENWFLFWHTFEVHAPYLHADFLPEQFAAQKAEFEKFAMSMVKHSDNNRMIKHLMGHGMYNRAACESLYAGNIRSMDNWTGRLVEKLHELGLYDRTMIVFTSDHGEEFADHSPSAFYDSHGHSMYEEMVRVPLIIKLPRQDRASVRVAAVSRAVDVMPTILEYLGVQPSADEMQGESLRAMWENPSAGHQRVAFSEAATTASEIKGVRTDRYKYVIRIDPSVVKEHGRAYVPDQVADRMLFDLANDPREQQNLLLAPGPVLGLDTELDTALRHFAAIHSQETDVVELDEQTIERLKALGYVQ